MQGKMPLARPADAENINRAAVDREQYPVTMPSTAIEQLPHLEWNRGVFRSQRATRRSGSSPSRFHLFARGEDACNCFVEFLAFPFECGGQNVIERRNRILSMSLRVLLQLGFTFGFDRHHIHGSLSLS